MFAFCVLCCMFRVLCFVFWCLVLVACGSSCVVRCVLFVVCSSCVACCVLFVVCRALCVLCVVCYVYCVLRDVFDVL